MEPKTPALTIFNPHEPLQIQSSLQLTLADLREIMANELEQLAMTRVKEVRTELENVRKEIKEHAEEIWSYHREHVITQIPGFSEVETGLKQMGAQKVFTTIYFGHAVFEIKTRSQNTKLELRLEAETLQAVEKAVSQYPNIDLIHEGRRKYKEVGYYENLTDSGSRFEKSEKEFIVGQIKVKLLREQLSLVDIRKAALEVFDEVVKYRSENASEVTYIHLGAENSVELPHWAVITP